MQNINKFLIIFLAAGLMHNLSLNAAQARKTGFEPIPDHLRLAHDYLLNGPLAVEPLTHIFADFANISWQSFPENPKELPCDMMPQSLIVSPDGRSLSAVSLEGKMRKWNTCNWDLPPVDSTIEIRSVRRSPPIDIRNIGRPRRDDNICCAISVDENYWASRYGATDINIWQRTPPEEHSTRLACVAKGIAPQPDSYGIAAFSPDGNSFAAKLLFKQEKISIWDIPQGIQIKTLDHRPADSQIACITFSADGKLFAAASEPSTNKGTIITIWQARHGIFMRHFQASQESTPCSLAFSPNKKSLAVGLSNGTIILVDAIPDQSSQTRIIPIPQRVGCTAIAQSITFSPDGHFLAAGCTDHTVRVWDL